MIILTGGAGFIGSCLLKKLNDNGLNDILVVDHLGSGDKWKNLVGKRFSGYLHKNDFRQYLLAGAFDEDSIEAVFHLGACTRTTERDSDYIFDNNLNYSIELANFALERDIRFIYASSAASYGDGRQGYSDYVFNSLKPLNPYGLSKHLFDLWVLDNHLETKFAGLKFFNVYGPNEYHKEDMASMVFKSYNQIIESGMVRLFKSNDPVYPDGGQKRDFVYVNDVVDLIWKMYNTPGFTGIYNLGTGHAHTWNELVKAVFDALGRNTHIEFIDMPEGLTTQYQNYTCADMTKLNSTPCSFEFTPMHECVKDYVQNYLAKGEYI